MNLFVLFTKNMVWCDDPNNKKSKTTIQNSQNKSDKLRVTKKRNIGALLQCVTPI